MIKLLGIMSRFLGNERGNVLFMTAAAATMLITGTFLAIDHGMNLGNQSDVEAKLTACTKYPAKEWTWFRIRQATNSAGGPGNQSLIIPDASVSDAAAKAALAEFVTRCVNDGSGEDFATLSVDQPQIIVSAGVEAFIRFDATIDQARNFGGGSNTQEARNRTIAATSVTRLPFIDSTPRDNVVTQAVFSLDRMSQSNMTTNFAQIMTEFNNAVAALGVGGLEDIHSGLELGNIPVENPVTGIANRHPNNANPRIGWSGGVYDNVVPVATIDYAKNHEAWEHRFWPFEAQFLAKDVRRCAGDPVWTYIVGFEASLPESSRVFVTNKNETHMNSCPSVGGEVTYSDEISSGCKCGEAPGGDNRCWSGCTDNGDGTWSCGGSGDPRDSKKKCCEVEKISDHIVDGHWMVACSRRIGNNRGFQLVPANEFVSLEARLVETLDGTAVPVGQQVSLYADPEVQNPYDPAYFQMDEMLPLKKKNSDRMMLYGCHENAGVDYNPGPPWGDPSHMGTNGLPDGRASWPLVNWNNINSSAKGTFESGNRDSACNLPSHANTVKAYSAKFYRSGRNQFNCAPGNPMGAGCEIPEGRYQIFVHVGPWSEFPLKQKLQERRDAAWMDARGIGTTRPDNNRPYGGGTPVYGWVESAGDQNCGYGSGPNSKNPAYHYPCAPANPDPKAAYVNKYYKHNNFYIPEEYLEIANIAVEVGRDTAGDAILQNVFSFDNVDPLARPWWNAYAGMTTAYAPSSNLPPAGYCNNSGSWAAVQGVYPDFCKASEIGRTYKVNGGWDPDQVVNLQENAYWTLGGSRGVMRYYGSSTSSGYPGAIGRYVTTGAPMNGHFSPLNMGDQAAEVCTLATVKENGSYCYPPANIPLAKNNFAAMVNILSSGYGNFRIHGGHGGNQGALLKAAARKMEDYLDDNFSLDEQNKMCKSLIYVGSCPRNDSFQSGDLLFNGSPVPWFANGNDSGGTPGTVNGFMELSAIKQPSFLLRQETFNAFQAVNDRSGGVMAITDASCMPEFDFRDSADPAEGFCVPGYTPPGWGRPMTTGDCAAELLAKFIMECASFQEVGEGY